MKTCLFKGKKYYLTNGDTIDSPLATKKQYENGLCSHAHLYASGNISRHGKIIGNKKDLKQIHNVKPLKPKVKIKELIHNFLSRTKGW